MDHFTYRSGALFCEDVPAAEIAARAGTPCYVYSRATLVEHYDRLAEAFAPLDPVICYAIKSCANLEVCRTLAGRGAGMDLVSGGELHRALLAGVDPARCVYAGVGKTDAEIRLALEHGVGWFNVESEAEFENISVIAHATGRTCRAALRVNPDVDPRTHRYTTTGKKETKFGVDIERARAFFRVYGRDPACRLLGIHLHIGSPVYRVEAYEESITKALALVDDLARPADGGPYPIEMLDLGGGFGADYESDQSPLAADYARVIVPRLAGRVRDGLRIVIEPGRTITANAGVLLLEVLYVKTSGDRTFVICDGGMNALLRPSHYDAFHFVWPCSVDARHVPPRRGRELDLPGLVPVDVVGPVCESGDFLALDRRLPPVVRGDRLAVFGTGAYGMVMASRYNSMPLPAEVMVDGASARVVRRAETYDDLTAHEVGEQTCLMGDPGMIAREDDGYWVVLEETIAIHHDTIFAALTTATGLTRWFSLSAEVDLRPGGLIVFGWDERMTRKSTVAILDYDPGGRIVWDWHADVSDTHAPVYWKVEPNVEQGSQVTLRQGPFRSDRESLVVMAEEAQTWRWYLCNLRSCHEAKLDMRKVRPL